MGRRCLPFVLSEPLRSGSWGSIAATTTQLPREGWVPGFYTLVLGLPARFRPGILYSSSFGDDKGFVLSHRITCHIRVTEVFIL